MDLNHYLLALYQNHAQLFTIGPIPDGLKMLQFSFHLVLRFSILYTFSTKCYHLTLSFESSNHEVYGSNSSTPIVVLKKRMNTVHLSILVIMRSTAQILPPPIIVLKEMNE